MVSDRRSRILEQVIEAERIDVNDLAAEFGVSQVTIRKDLDHLEQKGLIQRQHGYAVAIAPDNLLSRLAVHHETKRRIAVAAAALVPSGSTVMIESGSCCALLAEELARGARGITIITNSAFIADYVRSAPGASVVLLGGDYQAESQVTVGPLVEQCLQDFHVEAMARRAESVTVLTESAKFDRQGAVALLPLHAVGRVVTDTRLSRSTADHLTGAGLTLTTVAVD